MFLKNGKIRLLLSVVMASSVVGHSSALQSWLEQPRYTEVNPTGQVVMTCKVAAKQGECRWEKDGSPVGIYPGKYEWAGQPETGDCSLRVFNASLEYDDGVWQCQVTPSSFNSKDALISDGAQLVVRESPNKVTIRTVDEISDKVTAAAGEEVELKCTVYGGNPPATIRWFAKDQEIAGGHTQKNERSSDNVRTWTSVSTLRLPVSKSDNGMALRCMAEHPTLEKPLSAKITFAIHYPPTVKIETSPIDNLEEEKDPATLRCISDSNPPSRVLWKKEGLAGVFSPDSEITFSPVTRHTAGLYSCTAENALGMSKEAFIKVDVKFSPSILSVGPSRTVSAEVNKKTTLTCEAEGNPTPRYQWLQKLPTHEVLIRGYDRELVIENATYDHQGEFVCKAFNNINGEMRSVQSEPIRVEVSGAPQVIKYSANSEVRVQNGEDATLEVLFCADPLPKQAWHLGDFGAGNNIILAAGTAHGRFVAESVRKSDREDCYISSLRINGAHADDSHSYQLRLANHHGSDAHIVHLTVKDHVSQESLIAVVVGSVLTLLLLLLIFIYCCKAGKCCCSGANKKDFKPTDLESERTDVESTHSSHLSGYPAPEKAAAIPPDALYATREANSTTPNMTKQFDQDHVFNDSKESLRPDSAFSSNLNRTQSSSTELHNQQQQQQLLQHHNQPHYPVGPPRIVYNDLCFPKTSNYGSMKKKKNRDLLHNNMILSSNLEPQQGYSSQGYAHNGTYSS